MDPRSARSRAPACSLFSRETAVRGAADLLAAELALNSI